MGLLPTLTFCANICEFNAKMNCNQMLQDDCVSFPMIGNATLQAGNSIQLQHIQIHTHTHTDTHLAAVSQRDSPQSWADKRSQQQPESRSCMRRQNGMQCGICMICFAICKYSTYTERN